MRLRDRVVIITGGGRGIGAATARPSPTRAARSSSATCWTRKARPPRRHSGGRRGRRLRQHRCHEGGRLPAIGRRRRRAARETRRPDLLRGDPAGRHAPGRGAGRGHLRERARCESEGDVSDGQVGPAPPAHGDAAGGAAPGLGGRHEDPQLLAGLRRQQGGRPRLRHDAGGATRPARDPRERDLPVEHRDPHADREPGGPRPSRRPGPRASPGGAIQEAADPIGLARILAFLALRDADYMRGTIFTR